jgi:hypothetical protein
MGTYDTFITDVNEITSIPSSNFHKFKGKSDEEGRITIILNTEKSKIETFFKDVNVYSDYIKIKESYFLLAITNIIKKNNYLSLMLQLAQDQITEEEYIKDIEENPSKYVIDVKYLENPGDLNIINEIIKKIGLTFSIDEVAEIFALDSEDIEQKALQIKS